MEKKVIRKVKNKFGFLIIFPLIYKVERGETPNSARQAGSKNTAETTPKVLSSEIEKGLKGQGYTKDVYRATTAAMINDLRAAGVITTATILQRAIAGIGALPAVYKGLWNGAEDHGQYYKGIRGFIARHRDGALEEAGVRKALSGISNAQFTEKAVAFIKILQEKPELSAMRPHVFRLSRRV